MKASATGLLGCLVAWPLTCWAQPSAGGDSWVCTVDDARPYDWLARGPGPVTLVPEHERFFAYLGGAAPHSILVQPDTSLEFRDHLDYVARVRSLRALPLVRLWNSRNSGLVLGVDRRGGVYGIHLRREDPHQASSH